MNSFDQEAITVHSLIVRRDIRSEKDTLKIQVFPLTHEDKDHIFDVIDRNYNVDKDTFQFFEDKMRGPFGGFSTYDLDDDSNFHDEDYRDYYEDKYSRYAYYNDDEDDTVRYDWVFEIQRGVLD